MLTEKGTFDINTAVNVAGLNLEAQITVPHRLTFQAGYSYQYSRYIEPFQWSESLPAMSMDLPFQGRGSSDLI